VHRAETHRFPRFLISSWFARSNPPGMIGPWLTGPPDAILNVCNTCLFVPRSYGYRGSGMDNLDTSHSLLERARDRADSVAWGELTGLYVPLIRRWLRRYLLQPADADDLVQEVLTTVSRELSGFDYPTQRGAFRCWLRIITVHRLRAYWQARERRPRPISGEDLACVFDQLIDPSSPLSRAWDEEHDRHVVQMLLARIRDEFHGATWDAFSATALEGRPVAEVAVELNKTPNAVLLAKSRVLNRLRQIARGLVD